MLETFNRCAAVLGVLGFILLLLTSYKILGAAFLGIAGSFLLLGGGVRLYYWIKEKRKK